MKSTNDVDLLKFTFEFSIFVKFLIRHTGLPPTQKIAGEQIYRTLTECKTHNLPTGVGVNFLGKGYGDCWEMRILLYKDVTMEEPQEWDDDKELTDLEKIQLEEIMLAAAYENSYRVLTNKIDFADLVEEKNLIGISAIMAYDPTSGIRKEE
jgi:hypothetical protein